MERYLFGHRVPTPLVGTRQWRPQPWPSGSLRRVGGADGRAGRRTGRPVRPWPSFLCGRRRELFTRAQGQGGPVGMCAEGAQGAVTGGDGARWCGVRVAWPRPLTLCLWHVGWEGARGSFRPISIRNIVFMILGLLSHLSHCTESNSCFKKHCSVRKSLWAFDFQY